MVRVCPRAKRIENLLRHIAEIASQIGLGGYLEKVIGRPAITETLVGKEKERLVATVIHLGYFDWSSHRRAKHILPERSFALEESIASIQSIIAQVLPNTPVQCIGARLALYVDDPAQGTTKLSFVVVRLNLEFLNAINDRGNGIGAEESPLIVDPVQHEKIAAIALSIDGRESEGGTFSHCAPSSGILRNTH